MPAKALLVGINEYAKVPLRGCVNDVVQVRDLLTQRYRLADDRIRFITDAAATKAAIADGLRWLAQADPGETTPVRLFHFSGHGVFTPDNDHDEQDGRDECLVPVDYQMAGYIADDTLHESYARFSADTHLLLRWIVVIQGGSQKDIANDIVYRYLRGTDEEEARLDDQIKAATQRNCELKAAFVRDSMIELLQREAGSMSESELDRRIKAVMDQFDKIHYGLEAMPGNATLIAACRADQVAADARFDESYHGALTYYLTEALAGAGGQMPYSALIKQVGQAMGWVGSLPRYRSSNVARNIWICHFSAMRLARAYLHHPRESGTKFHYCNGGAAQGDYMYTEDSPLTARPFASPEQVVAYILSHPHDNYSDDDIRTAIVPAYFATCTSVGIDPILVIAQVIHETGNLTSFWSARPQRNPAGIGVNSWKQAERPPDITGWAFNTQRQIWEMGLSFKTWKDDAIPAHIGPAGDGWASPGADYGTKIAAVARQIAASSL